MFEPLPQKPPHFAMHRVALVGFVGGVVALVVAMWVFGSERIGESDIAAIGTFLGGSVVGVLAGWKLVMPRPTPPSE